jgi:hypothetical protein
MTKAWPVRSLRPDQSLSLNARRILRVRTGEFFALTPSISAGSSGPLHDLRIATKRMRYSIELFAQMLDDRAPACLERLKTLQEVLGDIHDIDVRIDTIQRELESVALEETQSLAQALARSPAATHQAVLTSALRPPPDDPRRGLISLLGRQYADRARAIAALQDIWHDYESTGFRADLVALSLPRPAKRP